ncbi:Nucleotide-diphospho-sugar transferase [Glarea lozoyensis ATCC 20868]|uniref:Nucleotide-diphospho-sugar transferase n=1 Tax=Glarea lozoyensis (strain ATCC 20868 / MF5171) TaxID=1116229 RepID=S3CYD3_GLAL2|nr:Nucleotide-diphospho-sugar transferase [Glarea lozoyensis ATCC 20868]EPE30625.1 Nucleotide-diphospho-sugar transferase [Glarea lozoyensis ATCC 20868]
MRHSAQPISSSRLFKIIIFVLLFIVTPYRIISVLLEWWRGPTLALAYATLLMENSGTTETGDDYFRSIRLLNYQLKHDEKTRTQHSIPLLVLVTPEVHQWKRKQLSDEGATVVAVEKFDSAWIKPGAPRWQDVMTKLRLFEFEEFDRILFLDADTFLLRPLDGVFKERVTAPRRTLHNSRYKADEGPLPNEFVFATLSEVTHVIHDYPPVPMSYFNAGFFLFAPSKALLQYYRSLFHLKDRFDTTYPEQNLLNYAHRLDGNMPWGRLHHSWNIVLPNMDDVKAGVASVHAKLWTEGEALKPVPRGLQEMWRKKNKEMEEFYKRKANQSDKIHRLP